MSLISLTHALSHMDAMTCPVPSETTPATTARGAAAPSLIPTIPTIPVIPVIGGVDAATPRTAHIRASVAALAAHRARSEQRLTPVATDTDTSRR